MHGAGYFPDHTLTEDYALGMEMRRTGWREVYVEDELVRGSAPDKVRGAFGQRSRWCKVNCLLLSHVQLVAARVGGRADTNYGQHGTTEAWVNGTTCMTIQQDVISDDIKLLGTAGCRHSARVVS